jgi:hypothetical protein
MSQAACRAGSIVGFLVAGLAFPSCLQGEDALQWSGFVVVRGATEAAVPLDADRLSTQAQLGIDWSSSPTLLAHLHLLARTDDGDARRGHAGTPEAYLEGLLRPGANRIRLRAGAFFLPTSRENVDALWENPYAVSSSALNTWFGEELRPLGLDVSWTRGGAMLGATVFRGNDTFGALPLDPGWELDDRWTLLGEKVRSGDVYSSASAETDGRLGWSARAGWRSPRFSVLLTHVDNRSDGLRHGDLYNWNTQQNVAGFDCSTDDWTVAGETGWGPTMLFYPGGQFQAHLRASYLLLSRRLPRGRATARIEAFDNGTSRKQALTLAGFWTLVPKLTLGAELAAAAGQKRALGELRYRFSRR